MGRDHREGGVTGRDPHPRSPAPADSGAEIATSAARAPVVHGAARALVAAAVFVTVSFGILTSVPATSGAAVAAERSAASATSRPGTVGSDTVLPSSRPLDFTPFEAALAALDAKRRVELDALTSEADIATLRERLRVGGLDARELVLAYLSRIRRLDGELAAVLELNPDVLREAERLDAIRARGESAGRLHGIPILIKGNIATGDRLTTSAGAAALASHVAPRDAPVVARLREAGALILGKTNLSEWAYFMSTRAPSGYSVLGGQTKNPHGADLAVLGSSTGSAVAAAARFAAGTLGTETTGSIIAPAAANGAAGMRPTLGLLEGDLIVPITRALDSAGPIAPSVRDLAELLSAMAVRGEDDRDALPADAAPGRDFTSGLDRGTLDGLRVGVPSAALPADAVAGAVLRRVLAALERGGASVSLVTISPRTLATLGRGQRALLSGGMRDDVDAWLAETGAPVESLAEIVAFNEADPDERAPYGQDLLERARDDPLDPSEHAALAARLRALARDAMQGRPDGPEVDVLLSLDNALSLLYALGGTPAVTVPVGLDAAGQPHGATFVGPRPGTDTALLAIAHAFERSTRWRVEPTFED